MVGTTTPRRSRPTEIVYWIIDDDPTDPDPRAGRVGIFESPEALQAWADEQGWGSCPFGWSEMDRTRARSRLAQFAEAPDSRQRGTDWISR